MAVKARGAVRYYTRHALLEGDAPPAVACGTVLAAKPIMAWWKADNRVFGGGHWDVFFCPLASGRNAVAARVVAHGVETWTPMFHVCHKASAWCMLTHWTTAAVPPALWAPKDSTTALVVTPAAVFARFKSVREAHAVFALYLRAPEPRALCALIECQDASFARDSTMLRVWVGGTQQGVVSAPLPPTPLPAAAASGDWSWMDELMAKDMENAV